MAMILTQIEGGAVGDEDRIATPSLMIVTLIGAHDAIIKGGLREHPSGIAIVFKSSTTNAKSSEGTIRCHLTVMRFF